MTHANALEEQHMKEQLEQSQAHSNEHSELLRRHHRERVQMFQRHRRERENRITPTDDEILGA